MNAFGALILGFTVMMQQSHASNHRAPIEKLVAGYSLEKGGHVVIRDTKSGCYLVRTGE